MARELQIRNRTIGAAHPPFITAEIGVTCNYDMALTKQLIDVVKAANADAVKLIFWFPDEIMSDRTIPYTYDTVNGPVTENMFEMLQQLRFDIGQWKELKAYADRQGVILFATVNSPSGVDYAEEIGLEAYKLSSWDYNHHPLWRRIAALGKPMLIDTGPVTTLDVAKVMRILQDEDNDQHMLVHCIHTQNHAEMNMRAIPYMRAAFNTLVGYSADNRSIETDLLAVALGAVLLEKRLTISRGLPGHHHILALEPQEFIEYVRVIRDHQAALGVEAMRPSPNDLAERKKHFRHLVANTDLAEGTVLTAAMLEGKRPEAGISPEYLPLFVGRTLKRDLRENEALAWTDI